ncbi:MAG: biotin/lipoyl-containing protein [Pseudoalteromonas prydzensis]|uniref:biotin/lipoyl-containing protein n=1 Tax=Pseudoalteromonas prydzensis TaxID=182141 RepID=UPI003F96E786
MNIDVKVPAFPDSIRTADVAKLYVSEGQLVYAGDILFDVETEKVVLEVMADCNGIIENVTIANGDPVNSEQVVMTVKQLADSEMPARPKAQSANNSTSDLAEQATVTPPLFSKFNVSLIIALAVGALVILFVLGK